MHVSCSTHGVKLSTEVTSASPCPRCSSPAMLTTRESSSLGAWFRYHCARCTIGRGHEMLETARIAWEEMVHAWGR